MTSSAYDTIRSAMSDRLQVVCEYHGYTREICFHAIGLNKISGEQALGFQFAGESSKGLPDSGEWRCLEVAKLSNISTRAGDWYTGGDHLKPQTCVKEIDLEIMG